MPTMLHPAAWQDSMPKSSARFMKSCLETWNDSVRLSSWTSKSTEVQGNKSIQKRCCLEFCRCSVSNPHAHLILLVALQYLLEQIRVQPQHAFTCLKLISFFSMLLHRLAQPQQIKVTCTLTNQPPTPRGSTLPEAAGALVAARASPGQAESNGRRTHNQSKRRPLVISSWLPPLASGVCSIKSQSAMPSARFIAASSDQGFEVQSPQKELANKI